jgi:hypothetical protein
LAWSYLRVCVSCAFAGLPRLFLFLFVFGAFFFLGVFFALACAFLLLFLLRLRSFFQLPFQHGTGQ